MLILYLFHCIKQYTHTKKKQQQTNKQKKKQRQFNIKPNGENFY